MTSPHGEGLRGPRSPLAERLAEAAARAHSIEAFVSRAGAILWRAHLGVDRLFVSLQTLHPAFRARTYLWRRNATAVEVVDWPHGLKNRPGYYASPDFEVHRSGTELRVRNLGDITDHPCALYGALKLEGYSDYLMRPLAFSDGTINTIAFATKRRRGFDARAVNRFRALTDIFVIAFERYAALETLNATLDTYLGRSAAGRVLSGRIRSGHGEQTDAAILFADLDGFTEHATRLDAVQTVRLLNTYFDCLVDPIEDNGGYVLKFIGDAVLAFFPLIEGAPPPRPMKAVMAICARLGALNQVRRAAREPPLTHALCGHFGRVLYGNVGSSERLDFTIIGEAVNMAARGVDKAKELGASYVFTREFVARYGRDRVVPLGRFALRGIADPVELFTLAAAPTSNRRRR